jgi:ADP-ribose pyrophosphatase YjhB (NUDIX family)
MHRQPVIELLKKYITNDKNEIDFKNKMLQFIENETECFERSLLIGHITASAFIINHQKSKTLLVKHAKLNRWLQPGGHCDGVSDVALVSLKETQEETGLTQLDIKQNQIFDIDIHTIPQRKEIPSHLHYDIRFLIIANELESVKISDESTDIQWIKLSDVYKLNEEESIIRMVRKIQNW